MQSLYRYSIRNPRRVVIIALAMTLAVAPGALRLELQTDGHALVPIDAPEVLYDKSIRESFGIEDPIVIVIRTDHADGIFNTRTLELVSDLTAKLRRIERIRAWNVFSLATERNNRVMPGTLRFRTFLEPLPRTPRDLARLRNDLRRIRLYTGTLVSHDGKGTSILVGVPPEMDRAELYRTIQEAIAARELVPEKIHVIGAPVAEALLGTHILEDLGVPSALLGPCVGRDDESSVSHVPRTLHELRLLIARYVGLVPVAIAIMVIVFAVSFRSVVAAFLPMTEVAACLIVVFGLMGWFGVPIYLTIAVLPVILTAIGVADEIHIFGRYVQEVRTGRNGEAAAVVTATMDEMWVPVAKTSVTTAIGFLSFALSPIAPVRAFGVFMAVGIVFCMLWSLTVIPALLVLVRPRRFRGWARDGRRGGGAAERALRAVAGGVVRHRYVVLGVALVVVAVVPLGLRRVVVQDSWINGFAESSEFHRATRLFNDQFLGMHILLVSVDTGHSVLTGELRLDPQDRFALRLSGAVVDDPQTLVGRRIRLRRPRPQAPPEKAKPRRRRAAKWEAWIETAARDGDRIAITTSRRAGSPRGWLRLSPNETATYEIVPWRFASPETLRRIADLEDFIAARRDCAVGGVIGTADLIETTGYMVGSSKEENRRIPDTRQRIAKLWTRYKEIRGVQRLRQVVDAEYSRSLVTVFLKDANFVDTARLMDAIREYEQTELAPHGITLGFAGDVAVSQTLIGAIVSTQLRSLLVSFVGIIVVTSVLGRSLRWGLYCVLPCTLAMLINFAVMGWSAMPLGVATSMFAGMTLGIGVDFAIHLLERYRLARSHGHGVSEAAADAVTVAGPAIIIDGVGIALGFGVMTLSQVPANARLGALVVLSIVNCLAVTLVVLPALLRVWPPRPLRTERR